MKSGYKRKRCALELVARNCFTFSHVKIPTFNLYYLGSLPQVAIAIGIDGPTTWIPLVYDIEARERVYVVDPYNTLEGSWYPYSIPNQDKERPQVPHSLLHINQTRCVYKVPPFVP
jgi:hypothetical protein